MSYPLSTPPVTPSNVFQTMLQNLIDEVIQARREGRLIIPLLGKFDDPTILRILCLLFDEKRSANLFCGDGFFARREVERRNQQSDFDVA